MTQFALHNYFRSSTSVRVRVALNLKEVAYEYIPRALLANEHKADDHLALNPQGLVPTLLTPEGALPQSLAIIEWLEEEYPNPPFLPKGAFARARVRSLAHIVAMDIHPVNNLRVLQYLETEFQADAAAKTKWFTTWARAGFEALEARLSAEAETGAFCHGDAPGLADICLFAQVVNNERFGVGLEGFPTIAGIHQACLQIPAFERALPAHQPDAQ